VHLDEPVDEDRAHLVVDVGLDQHVVRRNLSVGLREGEKEKREGGV
jgi:hypothetical protein